MLLNDKEFELWQPDDLNLLLNNPDFTENEWIGYKKSFSFFEVPDKAIAQQKKNEFRHDICSFANAEGGYIFFGITEKNGVATDLCGIDIPDGNTDKFELDRRNDISIILPATPNVKFRFISIGQKYVVILKIDKGFQSPYVCRENEDNYRFFVRRGNSKRPVSYSEVQRMFTQSAMIAQEMHNFRLQRAHELLGGIEPNNPRTAIIHIIPATMLEPSTYVEPYKLLATKKVYYPSLFQNHCSGIAMPNVDGLNFPPNEWNRWSGIQIYNNNIIERLISLKTFTHNDAGKEALRSGIIFEIIPTLLKSAISYYRLLKTISRAYNCITVLGCVGLCSDYDFYNDYTGLIDRNQIFCQPLEINDITNDDAINEIIKSQSLSLCWALGIKNTKKICGYTIE